MKILAPAFLMLCFLLVTIDCSAAYTKDARLTAVTSSELVKLITSTPLDSPLQEELLLRASHSHLMNEAYDQYTILWKLHPDDANANLMRGVAAEYLGWDSMIPEFRTFYPNVNIGPLFLTATDCLLKAVKLAPRSAKANMEAGFFLWQFGNNQPQGLSLLRKALRLSPNETRVHTLWGMVYSNTSPAGYDIKKAIFHLRLASQLDPTYAFPHEVLAGIYQSTHQKALAAQEQKTFHQLIP